jgi:hypothetical protein
MVGENAMNTPTAEAAASLFGESFRWKIPLMRSLIFFIE